MAAAIDRRRRFATWRRARRLDKIPRNKYNRPVPTKGARSRALGAGTAGGAVAEMRCRGLRDQAGDIRRGWCGGRWGAHAPSVAAAQAVRHPAHLPCATSGGYQGLSTGGRRSKPQTPRAGRRRFGGLAALTLLGKPRCREAPRPVGPAGSRRSARPLFFRRERTISTTGDPAPESPIPGLRSVGYPQWTALPVAAARAAHSKPSPPCGRGCPSEARAGEGALVSSLAAPLTRLGRRCARPSPPSPAGGEGTEQAAR